MATIYTQEGTILRDENGDALTAATTLAAKLGEHTVLEDEGIWQWVSATGCLAEARRGELVKWGMSAPYVCGDRVDISSDPATGRPAMRGTVEDVDYAHIEVRASDGGSYLIAFDDAVLSSARYGKGEGSPAAAHQGLFRRVLSRLLRRRDAIEANTQ